MYRRGGIMKKIWYQSTTPLSQLVHYRTSLENHAKRVSSSDFAYEFYGLEPEFFGELTPTETYNQPYLKHRITSQIIEIARLAESRGYSAFVLGSYSEPFLTEIRSILKIPVISLVESALLTACTLGERAAYVSLSASAGKRLEKIIAKHGLSDRTMGPFYFQNPITEKDLESALSKPEDLITAFKESARKAIQAGADVVIPAEGVLNEVLSNNCVKEVDEAHILDGVGACMLFTEMAVNLYARTGAAPGRRWAYQFPKSNLPPIPKQVISSFSTG
jgi:allantoin racemase